MNSAVGQFAANAAWLVYAASAFNLTRAAGSLAVMLHARATTGTIRAQLTAVPARLPRSARRTVLTCHSTGRGNTPGSGCSPPPVTDHRNRPEPVHQSTRTRPETNSGKAGQTGEPNAPCPPAALTNPDQQRGPSLNGGSGS
jgi:hypothetical protein